MPTEVLMPALSPTMEEGTLAKWLVKEGDTVSSGDLLAEIETDKAVMEFEAVDEGIVGKILVPEGSEGVKVNTPIVIMLEEGESVDDIAASAASTSALTMRPRGPDPVIRARSSPLSAAMRRARGVAKMRVPSPAWGDAGAGAALG